VDEKKNTMAVQFDLPVLSEDDAKRLVKGPFGTEILRLVIQHSTFVVFGIDDASTTPKIRNGSCFFIETPSKLLAVTARHVIEGFRELRAADERAAFQIGNIRLDPEERLSGLGMKTDIATLEIKAGEIARLKKAPITIWPPYPPETDDHGVLLCGYPAAAVIRQSDRVASFGIYASTAVAQRVTDRQLSCTIEWENVIPSPALGGLPPKQYEVGGMSGGPVLSIREHAGILTFPIAGVISEGRAEQDKIIAERGDSIRADGTIRD
jgi:hypothetical protein